MVKNVPAMQETWVRSLGQKDPLEKGMATLSSIPYLENPCGPKESAMTEKLTLSVYSQWKLLSQLHPEDAQHALVVIVFTENTEFVSF